MSTVLERKTDEYMLAEAYSPLAVANFFLDCGNREKKQITMLRLVKLVYIAHGWNLGTRNRALIDEEVQAWKYGPVIPSLYHEFKQFGHSAITEKGTLWDCFDDETFEPVVPSSDTMSITLMSKVWEVYKPLTSGELIALTHQKGTPWHQVFLEDKRGIVIPNDIIAKYYRNALAGIVRNPRAETFKSDDGF